MRWLSTAAGPAGASEAAASSAPVASSANNGAAMPLATAFRSCFIPIPILFFAHNCAGGLSEREARLPSAANKFAHPLFSRPPRSMVRAKLVSGEVQDETLRNRIGGHGLDGVRERGRLRTAFGA